MNRYAVYHMPDSQYCFPVSEKEIVLRLRTAKNDIQKAYVIYENKYDFGVKQKKTEMTKAFEGELFDYFTIKLTLEDTRLAYVLYIYDGEEYYYFSEDGITKEYDYTLGYYNFFQYPYINKADIMHDVLWMHNAVFYQIFVDRFAMGDANKDKTYINCKWGDVPTPSTFAGGDLVGICENLDYIKSLGVNAIYLTPVFESDSNHKYDIIDYMKTDSQFGGNAALKNLIDTAHKKGMRIVLDAVFNHCSYKLEQFQDCLKNGRKSKYYDWFIIHGDKPDMDKLNYEMFGPCNYMPKLNTSNAEVQRFLIDIACHYLKEYKIDGWRLDVSDEVSHDFWRSFRKKVKEINEDAVIIGENWHDASNCLRGEQYDSIMNYSFTKCMLDYFATNSKDACQAAWKLCDILMRNTDTVNNMMLNLLDSHDTHRFYTQVGCDIQKLKSALCILFLFKGTPCIYYGTEVLMEGGYDPDCRRCMDFSRCNEEDKNIISFINKLSALRKQYDLSQGRYVITSQNDVFIMEIHLETDIIKLFVNNTCKDAFVNDLECRKESFVLMVNDKDWMKE